MKIELDRNELSNILVALNIVDVKGRPNMLYVLRLMSKLEEALKSEQVTPEPPLVEEPKAEEG